LLGSAATALEAATSRASEGMGQAIDDALTRAAEQSSKVMDAAFSGFGERFDQASGGMIETLRTTAGQMERIAASIERSTAASDRHSDKLIEAGSAADGIATALAGASTEFQAAAAPIREATTVVSVAVNNVKEMLKIQSDAAIMQSESVSLIAEKLGETADSASRAWTQYRDRFEDVDKSLAEALNKIKDASSEHASSLNEQTGKVDKALADAIDRLAPALDPLGELADTIEDLIGRLKAQG
jgi:ABC-type transporter Mla subunit MlaD